MHPQSVGSECESILLRFLLPLNSWASINGQNCLSQQELEDTALSIDKTSIGKRQAAFRKSLHLGTIFSRGAISAIFCGLGVALPQVAHADITIISTPTTSQQGPNTPPLNGSDTLIITPSTKTSQGFKDFQLIRLGKQVYDEVKIFVHTFAVPWDREKKILEYWIASNKYREK